MQIIVLKNITNQPPKYPTNQHLCIMHTDTHKGWFQMFHFLFSMVCVKMACMDLSSGSQGFHLRPPGDRLSTNCLHEAIMYAVW